MLTRVLRRSVSVYVVAIILVTLGIFSLWKLPVALLPTLERPRLEIELENADKSREELLHEMVMPLERGLAGIEGVVDVLGSIDDGRAALTLETEWQTDVDQIRIDVQRRLSDAASGDLDRLNVEILAGDPRPILQVAVLGGANGHARTVFAEKVLVPELGRLDGAGNIEVIGGAHRRAVVRPKPAQLASHGVTVDAILKRLRSVGRAEPLGALREGGLQRPLVLRRPVTRLEELQQTRISEQLEIRLGDVASVTLEEVPAGGLFRRNGEPGVLVEVYRAPGANAVVLARQGREAIRNLAERARHLRLELVRDGSREVVAALTELASAGGVGLVLGTFVLWWMLGSWRPTIALAVVVPVSIIAAFSAFYFFGVSLDIVSLAGLALAAGMLVDNSIVVLEAISAAGDRGDEDPVESGTRQIAMALVASFLTTAVVFLPLVYLKGMARAFFGVQAFAIVTTLLISLGLSLTLTPILARRVAAAGRGGGGRGPGRQGFMALLGVALAHPLLTILLSAATLFGGFVLARSLPTELVPRGSSNRILVDLGLPAGLEVEEAERRLLGLEEKIMGALGAADSASASAPSPEASVLASSTDPASSTSGISSVLIHRDEDAHLPGRLGGVSSFEIELGASDRNGRVLGTIEDALARTPGLRASVSMVGGSVSAAVDQQGRGTELELSATTPGRLERLIDEVRSLFADQGAEALRIDQQRRPVVGSANRRPSWSLGWDPVRLAALDLREDALMPQLRGTLGRGAVGRVEIEGVESEIHVEAQSGLDLEAIPIRVPMPGGGDRMVPLSALASVEKGWREMPLERRNGRPAGRLELNIGIGRTTEILRGHVPAADEVVELGGRERELRRSFSQLALALGLALILVFLTIAAIYESLAMPLVVMATVPVAAVGAFGGLAIGGQSLNVMSLLGLILLTGIVVNNAIVLVHRAEQWRDEGLGSLEAVRKAASERYRPILMTTLTTLLGMLPLAILGGEGVELRRALAVSVSGGLVTSWAATLLLVPVLYIWARPERKDAGRGAVDHREPLSGVGEAGK